MNKLLQQLGARESYIWFIDYFISVPMLMRALKMNGYGQDLSYAMRYINQAYHLMAQDEIGSGVSYHSNVKRAKAYKWTAYCIEAMHSPLFSRPIWANL